MPIGRWTSPQGSFAARREWIIRYWLLQALLPANADTTREFLCCAVKSHTAAQRHRESLSPIWTSVSPCLREINLVQCTESWDSLRRFDGIDLTRREGDFNRRAARHSKIV